MIGKPKKEPPVEYDEKSVYVKNIHPKTSAAELEEHFASCGKITRTTICKDPMTGYSLGYPFCHVTNKKCSYGYIEFAEVEAVDKALKLSQSLFKGKQIEVDKKRKTQPGLGRKRFGMFPRFPMGRMFMPPAYGRMGYRYGY